MQFLSILVVLAQSLKAWHIPERAWESYALQVHYNKIAGVGYNLEVRILLLFSNIIEGVSWQCTKAVTGFRPFIWCL